MIENFVGITLIGVFLFSVFGTVLLFNDVEYGDAAMGVILGLVLALMGAAGWMLLTS